MTRPPYAIGARVVTRRHGTGVIERYWPAPWVPRHSTYAVRIPGRRCLLIVSPGEIREARA